MEETRQQLLRRQYQLANNVAAMIDDLLHAPTQHRVHPDPNAGRAKVFYMLTLVHFMFIFYLFPRTYNISVLFFVKLNHVVLFFISGAAPDCNPQPIHDNQPNQSTDYSTLEPIVS